MEFGHSLGLLVEQARSQHIREKVVVSIPPATVVERNHEQIGSIERFEHRLAGTLVGYYIAQRATKPVQDGSPQQEATNLFGLTLKDLFGEVIDDVTVVSGKIGNEAGDVVSTLHRKCRELERGDPSLGARLQRSDIARGEI